MQRNQRTFQANQTSQEKSLGLLSPSLTLWWIPVSCVCNLGDNPTSTIVVTKTFSTNCLRPLRLTLSHLRNQNDHQSKCTRLKTKPWISSVSRESWTHPYLSNPSNASAHVSITHLTVPVLFIRAQSSGEAFSLFVWKYRRIAADAISAISLGKLLPQTIHYRHPLVASEKEVFDGTIILHLPGIRKLAKWNNWKRCFYWIRQLVCPQMLPPGLLTVE